jgi:recombination protein RecT
MSTQKPNTDLEKKELTQSERFTIAVTKEASQLGEINLTDFQRKLCQNYFIRLDQQLKDLEIKRLATDEKYRAPFEYTWANVNMPALALGVIACASVELDASLPNHVSMVLYANKTTKKYDVSFTKGYKGLEIVGKKFALDPPNDVLVELVYSTDKFKIIKRDMGNPVEHYSFEIVNPFERGELIGLFYYMIYSDPKKNKCVGMSKADIDKRKPAKAAAEFWGGEKDIKKWDKAANKMMSTGEKEIIDGWYEKMAEKTGYRAAWNSLTLDSSKINANFLLMSKIEAGAIDLSVKEGIANNANTTTVDISHEEVTNTPEKLPAKAEKKKESKAVPEKDGEQEEINF